MKPLPIAAALLLGCAPPAFDRNAEGGYPNHNAPEARIDGVIVYQGPAPPVDPAGRPLGRVVLLLFAYDHPPPPRGLATTAESFQVLPASRLFAAMTVLPDGSVRASVPFTFPGITRGGQYQLRAFYSNRELTAPGPDARRHPTGFHPLFSIRNLPVRGDIVGGALDATAPAPVFTRITLGTPVTTGARTEYVLPEGGAVARGITVVLGTPIPTERPILHLPDLRAAPLARFVARAPGPRPPAGPYKDYARATGFLAPEGRILELPANLPIDDANPMAPIPSFPLRAGLPNGDWNTVLAAGIDVEPARRGCDPRNPLQGLCFLETPFDFNHNGVFNWSPAGPPADNADAHPTVLALDRSTQPPRILRFPWLFPLVVLTRLHDPNPEEDAVLAERDPSPEALAHVVAALQRSERGYLDLRDPAAPRPVYPVVVFGSVVPGANPVTGIFARNPPWTTPGALHVEDSLRVAVNPVAFEIRGPNPADWVALVPPQPPAVLGLTQALLPPRYRCREGAEAGIPQGRYAINVVTPSGQAWTLPNELAPLTFGSQGPTTPSQAVLVRVVAPQNPPGAQCPTPRER